MPTPEIKIEYDNFGFNTRAIKLKNNPSLVKYLNALQFKHERWFDIIPINFHEGPLSCVNFISKIIIYKDQLDDSDFVVDKITSALFQCITYEQRSLYINQIYFHDEVMNNPFFDEVSYRIGISHIPLQPKTLTNYYINFLNSINEFSIYNTMENFLE